MVKVFFIVIAALIATTAALPTRHNQPDNSGKKLIVFENKF
jgi:hypothetical protein